MLHRLLSSLAPPKSHRLTGENDLPLAAVRVAGCLIEELAGIGAKIETTGNDLVLRAGPHPIPSQLVRRVRDAKSDLIAVLRTNSLESQVVRRIDKHPVPSLTGQRAWCGKRERSDAVVMPFGAEVGMHARGVLASMARLSPRECRIGSCRAELVAVVKERRSRSELIETNIAWLSCASLASDRIARGPRE